MSACGFIIVYLQRCQEHRNLLVHVLTFYVHSRCTILVKLVIHSLQEATVFIGSLIHVHPIVYESVWLDSPTVRWCCLFGMGCRYHYSNTTRLLDFPWSVSLAL